MQVSLKVQKNGENKIFDLIEECYLKNPKSSYYYFGTIKESGFNLLEEVLVENDCKNVFILGIDKKNTTKSTLEGLLKYSKSAYIYNNNGLEELESSYIMFEYSNSAIVISSAINLSASAMTTNTCIYTVIEYDFSNVIDKNTYKENLKIITEEIKSDESYNKLNKEYISELIENKEIFSTKQYVHTVKSISELLSETKKPKKVDTNKTTQIDIDISDSKDDILFDIDFDEKPEIKLEDAKEIINQKTEQKDLAIEYDIDSLEDSKNNENQIKENLNNEKLELIKEDLNSIDKENPLYDEELNESDLNDTELLDIEEMLFSKSDIKLDLEKIESRKKIKEEITESNDKEEVKVKSKKVDLANASNLILEIEDEFIKVNNVESIKIPNYVKTKIPNFFDLDKKGKLEKIDNTEYKVRNISLEVVDAKSGLKFSDRTAKILHKKSQSYITITSDILKNIRNENVNIARIIKLSDDIYHIEIIQNDLQEYKIWKKLCTQDIPNKTSKYGIM